MTTQRLFPSTNGPAAVSAASGGWLLGALFSPQGKLGWLNGYYGWVPNNGDTTPRKWALWTAFGTGSNQSVVAGSTVTSGTLTQGAWNFTALPTPIQLSPAALYIAATGWTATNGIPVTSAQFGSGDPFAAGIVNGFLTGWSAVSGSHTFPAANTNYGLGQMMFSNSLGADPGAAMPNNGSGDDNLWVDILLSDTAPANYTGSYRFRPNQIDLGNYSLDTANGFSLGLQFSLSQSCAANNVWFYSPATVSVLPTAIGVYRTSDQSLQLVNLSPSWKTPSGGAASAGGGWCKAAITGTLPAGTYKVVVFQGSNVVWNAAVPNFWSTGFGANGLVAGPMSAPNTSGAVSPGQASYNTSTSGIAYPNNNIGPYDYGVDIEATPISSSGLLMASGII